MSSTSAVLCHCRARQWVLDELNLNKKAKLSFFETTIRLLGGLLSAYDLTGDDLFLQKAQSIADKLLVACEDTQGDSIFFTGSIQFWELVHAQWS